MREIVILSGSPSTISRTESVLHYLGRLLEEANFSIQHISVRDFSPEDLIYGNYNRPDIQKAADSIQQAKGVIVGSPVYKGSYSGALKTLLDILPQDLLEHTPVLPIMIGGTMSHLLAIEYALKPVLAHLKGLNLKGIYLMDEHVRKQGDIPISNEDGIVRLKKQLYYLMDIVASQSVVATETKS